MRNTQTSLDRVEAQRQEDYCTQPFEQENASRIPDWAISLLYLAAFSVVGLLWVSLMVGFMWVIL